VVDPFDDESNRSPVAFPVAIRLRNSHERDTGATVGVCSPPVDHVNSMAAGCGAGLEHHGG